MVYSSLSNSLFIVRFLLQAVTPAWRNTMTESEYEAIKELSYGFVKVVWSQK